jgi:hypothetical protein
VWIMDRSEMPIPETPLRDRGQMVPRACTKKAGPRRNPLL